MGGGKYKFHMAFCHLSLFWWVKIRMRSEKLPRKLQRFQHPEGSHGECDKYISLCLHTSPNKSNFCLPGAQLGLVSTNAGHVFGQQWRRWGAKWDQKSAGETGVHNETGVQPLRPADRAQGTGRFELKLIKRPRIWFWCLTLCQGEKTWSIRGVFFFFFL